MSNKEELKKEALEKVAGGKIEQSYKYKVGDQITIYKDKVGYITTIVQRGVAFSYTFLAAYRVSCSANKVLESKWYVEDYFSYEKSIDSCQYPE